MLMTSIGLSAKIKTDSVCYRYAVAEVRGQFLFTKCRVKFDDGTIKAKKEPKVFTFTSHAAAINYFVSLGWELMTYNQTESMFSASENPCYWILRKPSTKKELNILLEETVEQ